MFRNIIDKIGIIIDNIIKINNLNKNEYFVYLNIKENFVKDRNSFFKNKFFEWIKGIKLISQDSKDNLLNLFLTQRESIKMTGIEKNEFLYFNIIDKLISFNSDTDKYCNDYGISNYNLISLEESDNKEGFTFSKILNCSNEIFNDNNNYISVNIMHDNYNYNFINSNETFIHDIVIYNNLSISQILKTKGIEFNDYNNFEKYSILKDKKNIILL